MINKIFTHGSNHLLEVSCGGEVFFHHNAYFTPVNLSLNLKMLLNTWT